MAERPAGWYHAEGDPPGTQRYWDGTSWQGAPQPHAGASTSTGAVDDYRGFFPSLVDFGVTSFIAPRMIRVFYVVGFVLIALIGLIILLSSVASGGSGIIVGFVVAPVLTLIYITILRIQVEVVIVAFRVLDEVRSLRRGG